MSGLDELTEHLIEEFGMPKGGFKGMFQTKERIDVQAVDSHARITAARGFYRTGDETEPGIMIIRGGDPQARIYTGTNYGHFSDLVHKAVELKERGEVSFNYNEMEDDLNVRESPVSGIDPSYSRSTAKRGVSGPPNR